MSHLPSNYETVNNQETLTIEAQPLTFTRLKPVLPEGTFKARGTPPEPDMEVAAISVNGELIEIEDILAEAQHHPASNASTALDDASRALVIKTLLLQEAARLDIVAEPETDSEGRMETDDDALIRALLEQEVHVPLAERTDCQRYYDLHPDKFCSDTIYEVRHILLASHADDSNKRHSQRAMAETLIEHLLANPGDIAKLAREHSDCPSREHGGNLGQLTRGSTVREFEQALGTIKPGGVASEPVETRFGFHVVEVVRCVPGEILPFEAVRERIAAWLEASSWSKAVCQYVSILAGQADLEGYTLNAVDTPLVQ